MTRYRSAARKLLGAPFRLSRQTSGPGLDYRLLGEHHPVLRTAPLPGFEAAIEGFRAKRWTLRKFAFAIRDDLLLDTGLGWVVRGRELVTEANWGLLEQTSHPTKPNVINWLRAQASAQTYEKIVWLPFGSGNYWHFLNDFVAGLHVLLDQFNLTDFVVPVSAELWQRPFFREIISCSTTLSGLNFVRYSADRWLRCPHLLTAGTFFGSHETFRDALSLLDRLPPVRTEPRRKVFVSRAATAWRNASNLDELEALFVSRGFVLVRFEDMTFLEQREAINSASHVVALHGAGMANLAFHQHPDQVKVLELTAADYLNPCFAYLAEEAGMDYYCLSGGPRAPATGNFHVPADDVTRFLDRHFA